MKLGFLEAGLLLLVGFVVAQLITAVWMAFSDGPYLQALGFSLVLVGILSGLFGGEVPLSRIETSDERAFLGQGVERSEKDSSEAALTSAGRFVLVSLPLILLGLGFISIGAG